MSGGGGGSDPSMENSIFFFFLKASLLNDEEAENTSKEKIKIKNAAYKYLAIFIKFSRDVHYIN